MSRAETLHALARAVDAEALRQTVRTGVRQNGQHVTALLIGVPRTVLRKVLAMSNPRPASLERIRAWALDRPEPAIEPGLAALAVLAGELPSPFRAGARSRLARALAVMHVAAGAPPPEWVIAECLDDSAAPPEPAVLAAAGPLPGRDGACLAGQARPDCRPTRCGGGVMSERESIYWALTPDGWRRAAGPEDYPAGTVRLVRVQPPSTRNLHDGVGVRLKEEMSPGGQDAAAARLERIHGPCPDEPISDDALAQIEAQLRRRAGPRPVTGDATCWDALRASMIEARWLREQLPESIIRR